MADSRNILIAVLAVAVAISCFDHADAFSCSHGLKFSQQKSLTRFSPQMRNNKSGVKMSSGEEDPEAPPVKRTGGFKTLFEGFTRELNQDTVIYDENTGQRRLKASSAQILLLLVGQFTGGFVLYQLYKLISAAVTGGSASG